MEEKVKEHIKLVELEHKVELDKRGKLKEMVIQDLSLTRQNKRISMQQNIEEGLRLAQKFKQELEAEIEQENQTKTIQFTKTKTIKDHNQESALQKLKNHILNRKKENDQDNDDIKQNYFYKSFLNYENDGKVKIREKPLQTPNITMKNNAPLTSRLKKAAPNTRLEVTDETPLRVKGEKLCFDGVLPTGTCSYFNPKLSSRNSCDKHFDKPT